MAPPTTGPTRAKLTGVTSHKAVQFMFNPEKLVLTKSVSWAQQSITDPSQPVDPHCSGTSPSTLKITGVVFDANAHGPKVDSVVDRLIQLRHWCTPTTSDPPSAKDKHKEPESLTFAWGDGKVISSTAQWYLTVLKISMEMFDNKGQIRRASVDLSFTAVDQTPKATNPSSEGGLQSRRAHRMRDGDSLQSVAYNEYAHPSFWRGLAAANGVDDPMRISPGSTLVLPSVEDAAALL